MIKPVLADTHGATAVFTALVLATVTGCVALGIEAASGLHTYRSMQDAADAAALAGTLAFRAVSTGDPAFLASAVLARNGVSAESGDSISIKAPLHGNPDGRVEVTVSRARQPRFGSLLKDARGTIEVRSVAHLVEAARGCLLGLAPGSSVTIGRQSDLRLKDCSILSSEAGVPQLRRAEADPYRQLALPDARPCNARAATIRSATRAQSGGRPFLFCGGLRIESSGQLYLAPGVYAISGGPLIARKGSVLAGHGVSILLLAGASAHFAEGAIISLQAPAAGSYAGLAVAAGPTAGSSRLLAGTTQSITGAIHMPAQNLQFSGSASSPCTHIIANHIAITGVTRLQNTCEKTGTRPLLDRVARLAE